MIRLRRGILWVSILQLGLVLSFVVFLRAQSQETIDAIQQQRIAMNETRIAKLEAMNGEPRLQLLEADMIEVKWVGRSVATLVAGQLITMLLALRTNGKRHP